jgi:hypothetical protein
MPGDGDRLSCLDATKEFREVGLGRECADGG